MSWKYATNLQEKTHAELWFQWSCFVWLFSCYFAAYFQKSFSLRTPQDGCFWVSKILLKHLVVIDRISLRHYLSKVMHLLLFVLYRFFTNIPLDRTIKIILKRIYEYKLITTTLKKGTMKRLRTDVCKKKTIFNFNKNISRTWLIITYWLDLIANVFMPE